VRRAHIGVVGNATSDPERDALAEQVGRGLAEGGAVVVCGGLGGVMAAACRGAAGRGGVSLGLLPGEDRREANPWVTIAVPTGLGELRNGLVVRASDVLIAVGGEYGTLSEVALALKLGRTVVGLGTWELLRPGGRLDDGIVPVETPAQAVDVALAIAGSPEPGGST
jgi:uncharacterized protein (TIGR00725 family)